MKIEFAVQMTCESCVKKVQSALSGLNGISKLDIDLKSGTVMVDTELAQSIIKDKIEATGLKAVLKGYGQLGAAVAMLGGNTGFSCGDIKGVIRFVQENNGQCLIDGEIENPSSSSHGPLNISIYECGDISNNCTNLGNRLVSIFNQSISNKNISNENFKEKRSNDEEKSSNDIFEKDRFESNKNKTSSAIPFRTRKDSNSLSTNPAEVSLTPSGLILKTKNQLEISNIIGRSIVIEDGENHKLACAVIARSAGVSENKKVICACDGVTIWEERDRPVAGPGRRQS